MVNKITNWRSLGGLVGRNGKKVKENLLYRSGQLYQLTDEQIADLRDNKKIKRIFDFRGPEEVTTYPDDLWRGLDYIILDILEDANINQASVSEIISGDSKTHDNMMSTYEELALSSSAQKYYHQFLSTIASDPVPMIFHCFAGKDRTGVGAALILKALDVSEDQILDDYLKTNELRKEANEEILASLKDQLNESQLEEVRIALKVEADYLIHYFSTVNDKFGDFDHYFTDGLKLPVDFKETMQKQYLEQ